MSEKNEVKKKSRGRKSEYREEYAEQALKLCLLGATDKEIAEFFSVSEQTLNSWKKKFPQFLESLKKGKAVADANVASRLYSRAIGYEYIEHYPPDTTAAIFWLKNRQPGKWRDKKEVENQVKLGDELESMSDEELAAIIRGEKE